MSSYTYKISLRIRHPASSLEHEYKTLGAIPGIKMGNLQDIGAPRKDPKGNLLVGEYTKALFGISCTEQWQNSNVVPLEDALNDFIDKLSSSRDMLLKITETGGELDFFIGIKVGTNSGLSFGTNLLKRLADLNIEVGLDLYSSEDK